jgi:hypothetical protein
VSKQAGESLRDRVLAYVSKHPGSPFYVIDAAVGEDDGRNSFRRTDRALQSLRKAGKIEVRGQKWYPING